MAFQMAACTSIHGIRIARVSSGVHPISAYVGKTLGAICIVMIPVALQWNAVPRQSSSSSDLEAGVRSQRSSFLSDMSSYVSAWCSTCPSPLIFGSSSVLVMDFHASFSPCIAPGLLNSRC